MTVEAHTIENRDQWLAMRMHDVTASDIAAICGCSPFKTALKVWAEKAGTATDDGETDIMKRGRHLEDGVINAVREEWPDREIVKPGVYLRDPQARIGATPDAYVLDAAGNRLGVLQCKLIGHWRFKDDWADGVPLNYQLQILTEAMLAGTPTAWLAAYVIDAYRGELHLFEVPRHAGAEARIRAAAAQFWSDIEAGRMPAADYQRDGQLLALLKPPSEKVQPVDLSRDNYSQELLAEREQLNAQAKACKQRVDEINAEIIAKLDGAPAAIAPGWKITHTMTHRKETVQPAKSFPTLRVTRVGPREEAA